MFGTKLSQYISGNNGSDESEQSRNSSPKSVKKSKFGDLQHKLTRSTTLNNMDSHIVNFFI